MSEAQPSKLKRLAMVLVVVGGLVGGGVYWFKYRAPPAQQVTFYGNVDIRDVTLAFRVGGRVEGVLKHEGDQVKAGEVIAKLDQAPFRLAVAQAQAAVGVAEAQLKLVKAGSRPEDMRQARALLAERKAAQLRANDSLNRVEQLVDGGAATKQTLVEAQSGAAQAHAAVSAAKAVVAKTINGARAEDLAVAQALVEQAEAGLASAKLALADTELRAETQGVLVTRAIEPGSMVGPGSPALVVAVTDPVWIRGYASETAIAEIPPGTQVSVYTDARGNQPYVGQVGYVSAQAEFTPKNVETEKLRSSLVYRFRVIVTEHDGGLRQGMPVTIKLRAGGGG